MVSIAYRKFSPSISVPRGAHPPLKSRPKWGMKPIRNPANIFILARPLSIATIILIGRSFVRVMPLFRPLPHL